MTIDNETDHELEQSGLNYVGESLSDADSIDLRYVTDSLERMAERDPKYRRLLEAAQDIEKQVRWMKDEIERMLGREIWDSMRIALDKEGALELYHEFFDWGGDRLGAIGTEEYGHHTGWLLGRILFRIGQTDASDPLAAHLVLMRPDVLEKLWWDTAGEERDCDLEFINAYVETASHIKFGYEFEAQWEMAHHLGAEAPTDDNQIFRAMVDAESQVALEMQTEILHRLGHVPGRDWREDRLRFEKLSRLRDRAIYKMQPRLPGTATDPSALEDWRGWIDGVHEFYLELTRDEPDDE